MAIVQNTYTGNGSTTLYSLSFLYLDRADVKVTLNGVLTTAFVFVNDSTIQFLTAPAAGVAIIIFRETDDEETKATFFAGSSIKAVDLNSNFTQLLYVAQEVVARAFSTLGGTLSGILNMGGFRITNLGTPAADADGVTKKYVDDRYGQLSVPGVTRWRKTATAGQTTFSGSGDYGGTLAYSASREMVFVNGALQQRNVDYTADNGTSIIFTPALLLGDVVDVHCVNNAAGIATDQASGMYFTQSGTGATTRTVDSKLKEVVSVKDFGAVGNGVTNDTVAIQIAIASLRSNATNILDTIGGNTITAYSSGTVEFDRGVYLISPDTLRIYQDLGLTLRGKGSRRTNNAIRAATTILVSGTSSGYGIQVYRSGGRGLTIEDMDICYASSAFTGDVLDILDCPGVTLRRVFLGTYGLTGPTRLQTARSCIRSTYDEFLHAVDCVFDGAIDGWWSDDTRTELGNTFGGAVTKFDSCVWYDFTQRMIRHDGNRTRTAVSLSSCVFNPISVNCVRCVDLNNIDGLHMSGSKCAGSVANYATTEWMRLANVTGTVTGNVFSSLTKSGTIGGYLQIEGNMFAGTDGLTVTSGIVSGKSNEFRTGTNAWTLSPVTEVCVDIGPDIVLSGVTRSYNVPADSALLAGRVNYDAFMDQSASKFSNASGRISIENVDRKSFSISSSPYSAAITDTGRRILASSGSAQVINLPVPVPGTTIHISKVNNQVLTVNCPGGVNFYSGVTGVDTSAAASGSDIGSSLSLSAYATVGWIVTSAVGTWTFT